MLKLPFTHGIETEMQIVNMEGAWIPGDKMVSIMRKIVFDVQKMLTRELQKKDPVVQFIRKKVVKIEVKTDKKRGDVLVVHYKLPDGKITEIEVLGRDPHVGTITWILEYATPPCETVEELLWWAYVLVKLPHDALPTGTKLLMTGLNPIMEFETGLSFGDHHHIGMPNKRVKIAVYNMLRNFLPHLIALSVNSPLSGGGPTDVVEVRPDGGIKAPRCLRSIRLELNNRQLGPDDPNHYIPYISEADTPYTFEHHINRVPGRMSDMYPYTRFGTIEIRVFDSQISVIRKIGIAILIQALALKAYKYLKEGRQIPKVSSQTLVKNRRAAIRWGLQGPFFKETDQNLLRKYPDFFQAYQFDVDEGKPIRRMGDALIAMIKFVQKELEEMKVLSTDYLNPILLSLFGDRSKKIPPPFTAADYQLLLYGKLNDIKNVVREIEITADNVSANPMYDVLGGVPAAPVWLLPPEMRINVFVSLEPPVVFAGDPISCHIVIENPTEKVMRNPVLFIKILSGDKIYLEKQYSLGDLKPKTRKRLKFTFNTRRDVLSYQLKVLLKTEKAEIPLSQGIVTYNVTSKVDLLAPVDCIIIRGRTEIPFMVTVENNSPSSIEALMEIQLVDVTTNTILARVSPDQFGGPLKLRPNGHMLFAAISEMLAKRDWAAAVLSAQTGKISRIPPMVFVPKPGISSRPLCAIKTIVKKTDGSLLSETMSETFRMAVSVPRINWQVHADTRCDVGAPFAYRARVALREVSGVIKFVVRLVADSRQVVIDEKTVDLRQAGPIVAVRGSGIVPPDFLHAGHTQATLVIDIVKNNNVIASYTYPKKIEIFRGIPECKVEIIAPEKVFPGSNLEFGYRISGIDMRGKSAKLRFYLKHGNATTPLKEMELDPKLEGKTIKFNLALPRNITGRIEIDADIEYNGRVIFHFAKNISIYSLEEMIPLHVDVPSEILPGKTMVINYTLENNTRDEEQVKLIMYFNGPENFNLTMDKTHILPPGTKEKGNFNFSIPAFMAGKEATVGFVLETKYGRGNIPAKRIKIKDVPVIINSIYFQPPVENGLVITKNIEVLKVRIDISANVDYSMSLVLFAKILMTHNGKIVGRKMLEFPLGPDEKKRIALRVLINRPPREVSYMLQLSGKERISDGEYELPPSAFKINSVTFKALPPG